MKKMNESDISVIIPAHNEGLHIGNGAAIKSVARIASGRVLVFMPGTFGTGKAE
jgi:hypothetical protein